MKTFRELKVLMPKEGAPEKWVSKEGLVWVPEEGALMRKGEKASIKKTLSRSKEGMTNARALLKN